MTTITATKQLAKELATEQKLNKELLQKKSELEQTLTLQAARKVQSEHDKAEASKKNIPTDDKTGISIMRNVLTNSDLMEVQMLAILNAKRVGKGLTPFKDYESYLASQDPASAEPLASKSIVPTTKTDPVAPLDKLVEQSYDFAGRPLKADGDVYLIVNGGYYIGWNKSRCYLQKQTTNDVNILVSGDRLYGDSSVMTIIPNKSFRDLTRAEVDNILKGKPSYNDLFKVYSKFQNCQNVHLDTTKAQAVW